MPRQQWGGPPGGPAGAPAFLPGPGGLPMGGGGARLPLGEYDPRENWENRTG
jgi:hypothetical protein